MTADFSFASYSLISVDKVSNKKADIKKIEEFSKKNALKTLRFMYILLFSPHNKGIFCTYFAFCFVYRLFLRTFANDHRYDVQV